MWIAGLSVELAIFTLRGAYAKKQITTSAFNRILLLLKDARVRIRNADESFECCKNANDAP